MKSLGDSGQCLARSRFKSSFLALYCTVTIYSRDSHLDMADTSSYGP